MSNSKKNLSADLERVQTELDQAHAELEKLRPIVREIVAIDPLCGGGKEFSGKYFITGDLIVRAREAIG